MNTTNSLKWNGTELTSIGGAESSVVVRKNIETRPNKRATKIIIPGRNGAKYVDEGYFDNVTISYSLIFTDFAKYDAVVNYLLSVKGFARLEDEYDPDIYRMARVTSVNPQTPDRENCSLTKSCLILCNPMDCSVPGFPILHCLTDAQTHVR